MAPPVEVESAAYAKLLLHAATYPYAAVNGVLLGSMEGGAVRMVDAVPLFHSDLSLAPMLEIALTQVSAYAADKGLQIVGYYQANEALQDSRLHVVARTIGDKVRDNFSNAVILLVNNSRIAAHHEGAGLPFDVYASDGKDWSKRTAEDDTVSDCKAVRLLPSAEACVKAARGAVAKRRTAGLVDFDAHLDNVALDWRNPGLSL